MPFVGESGGTGFGGGASAAGDAGRSGGTAAMTRKPCADDSGLDRAPDRAGLPLEPGLAERLAEARRRAAEHLDHDAPRAPRPEKMQR